jgi:predicted O-linked N-acetylglucosamine transferase (SPINDLY family)
MKANTTLQQALALHKSNRFADAEKLYREVLRHEPLNAIALHHLGLIANVNGDFPSALRLIAQSIQLDSTNLSFRTNQISTLDAAGQHQAAHKAAEKLISERPDDVRLRIEYAKLNEKYGFFHEAAKGWEWIAARVPNDPGVLFSLARMLQMSGQTERAATRYRETLAIKPDFVEAKINLGAILADSGQPDQGIAMLEEAVRQAPDHVAALTTLGSVLTFQGKLIDGLEYLQRASRAAPNDIAALQNLAFASLTCGEVSEAVRLYDHARALQPAMLSTHSDLLFARLHLEQSAEDEGAAHRAYQQAAAGIRPRQPPKRTLGDGERLRIGYVSPDFREHAVGVFLEPLLTHHDRSRFEIHCFSTYPRGDALTERIRSRVDQFHEVHSLNLGELDEFVRSRSIDVLIDLAGHTGHNRLPLFACKPAFLQATYLGYPSTTGLDSIDIRLTDWVADPEGMSESIYSEKLVRLPNSFAVFQPPANAPEVTPSPSLANGYVTYGTLGRYEKWTAAMIQRWATILRAVPNARMRLIGTGLDHPRSRDQFLLRLQDGGIDVSRIDPIGRLPFKDYLAEILNFDLLLDTFPFNGHTTTIQALYMGVPTVTLAGTIHRSRMGASVMTAMGLTDYIAHSAEEYEQTAIRLGRDPGALATLRPLLRDRLLRSSLCDAPGFTRSFEASLLAAWEQKSEWTIS